MTNHAALLQKYGSEEAISEHYRKIGKKSLDHPNRAKGKTVGGFTSMDKDKLRELSRKAGKLGAYRRWHAEDKIDTQEQDSIKS